MELHGIFPWNSMENVQIFYGKYRWRNFHGNWFPYPPWNSMENVLILHADIFHGNPWRNFHGIPWKLMS